MTDAVFVVEGDRARATEWAAGPWDLRLQHGGAPSALIAWAAERTPSPAPMRIARLTVDLLRPVPVADLDVATEIVRQGRKIQLLQVRLLADGVEVVRGMVLKVRTAELAVPEAARPPSARREPPQQAGTDIGLRSSSNNFGANFEMRRVSGGFGELGPGQCWFRQTRPLVLGEALSPAMRAAAVADFSNGISAALPFDQWTFINGDLTVSLARAPVGEWILSDAESWIDDDGVGLAMTRLSDQHGDFGRAVQSLVVERR